MTQRLEVVEGGRAVRWPRSPDDADAIRRTSDRWRQTLRLRRPPLVVQRRADAIFVWARDVTGFVRVRGVDLEVRPKFLPAGDTSRWGPALWSILAAVDPRARDLGDVLALRSTRPQPDLLGRRLVQALDAALVLGVPRDYVERRGALPVLKGALDLQRLDLLVVEPHLVPCAYDEQDLDTPLNRLLRWAAQALAGLVTSPQLSVALEEAAMLFGDIPAIPPAPDVAARLVVPPTYRNLQPALEIARLLLDRQWVEHGAGGETASGFLWRSAEVFEDFVRTVVRAAARDLGLEVTGGSLALASSDGVRGLRTDPDVRVSDGRRDRVVLDAKYKVLAQPGVPGRADRYQVLVGARSAGAPDTGIVVPAAALGEPALVRTWTVLRQGVARLHVLQLDTLRMAEPHGLPALVEGVRDALATMLARQREDKRRERAVRRESDEAEVATLVEARVAGLVAVAGAVGKTARDAMEATLARALPETWPRLHERERLLLTSSFVLYDGIAALGDVGLDHSGLVIGPLAVLESVLVRAVHDRISDADETLYEELFPPDARGRRHLPTLGTFPYVLGALRKRPELHEQVIAALQPADEETLRALLDGPSFVKRLHRLNATRRRAAHIEVVDADAWAKARDASIGSPSEDGLISELAGLLLHAANYAPT